ncbi:MAG: DUF1566 domain-containing protein [Desulfobulbaceae bacterium]|nr:MAG: DUF1566 domain-containing protein [Desulfobulbaceae bacterium]
MVGVSCVLNTGLTECFDCQGRKIDCAGSGQDAEHANFTPCPEPRFKILDNNLVLDQLTQLVWPKDANIADNILNWHEGLEWICELNGKEFFGRDDWRMPNRRELRSLIDHSCKNPALPKGHVFENVNLGWYWTSTTSTVNNRYAWYLHTEGGRMFYGNKSEFYWVWPVAGENKTLPRTGTNVTYDDNGKVCTSVCNGQDGDLLSGIVWPTPRFEMTIYGVLDNLTGLVWCQETFINDNPVSWDKAIEMIDCYCRDRGQQYRLPTINELESLVDASQHFPALPANHPFSNPREAYWSSTTSGYETDWAYVLYLNKGAVGVGYKTNHDFHVWPVISHSQLNIDSS